MKTGSKILGIAMVGLLLLLNTLARSEEFTKKMSKSFDVNKNALLELKNKFGKIQCLNWDQDIVKVDVEITINTSNQDKADKYFNRINVDISGSADKVSVITSYDDNLFKNNNNDITIDFTIQMPESLQLEVNHKFGDLIIEKITGNSDISLGYGNFDIAALAGSGNMLDIQFSDGKIGYVKNVELELKYSDLEIDEAGSMNAETKFSDFELGKVDVLTLETGYDDDYIGFARDADIESSFSDVEIRNLSEKIVADIDYGELKVKEVDASFSLIDISNNFADASLGISPQASFKLVATIKMGSFNFPENDARFTVVDLSHTSQKYEGIVGDDENTTSRVLIDTKTGGTSLYFR